VVHPTHYKTVLSLVVNTIIKIKLPTVVTKVMVCQAIVCELVN